MGRSSTLHFAQLTHLQAMVNDWYLLLSRKIISISHSPLRLIRWKRLRGDLLAEVWSERIDSEPKTVATIGSSFAGSARGVFLTVEKLSSPSYPLLHLSPPPKDWLVGVLQKIYVNISFTMSFSLGWSASWKDPTPSLMFYTRPIAWVWDQPQI